MLVGIIAFPAFAKDYKIEVLVFENLIEQRAHEPHDYVEPKEMVSDSESWLLEPSMLNEVATTIEDSKDYQLKHYFSWGQESLPYSESTVFSITEEQLNGSIKIYANTLLFANIDIDYNGYRMNEKRRLKLNERHFFDHPKFGILMQVSRLEEINEKVE